MAFKYVCLHPDARAPLKAHPDDSGYDLVIIDKIKEENGVSLYDTGVIVQPPAGHYFEIYGRSSIYKSGYMLANNVGIIDQGYRGTLKIALIKVNPHAVDLKLPACITQLIPRQFIHLEPVQVDREDLDDTIRGADGFGSTTKLQ
jgi:dUTP pyrophosphatase